MSTPSIAQNPATTAGVRGCAVVVGGSLLGVATVAVCDAQRS